MKPGGKEDLIGEMMASARRMKSLPRGVIIVGRGDPGNPENRLYVAELDYATGLLIWEQRYPGAYSPDVVKAEKDGVLVAASIPDLWLVRLYHGEMPIPTIYPLLIVAFPAIILPARAIIQRRGSETGDRRVAGKSWRRHQGPRRYDTTHRKPGPQFAQEHSGSPRIV